MDKRTIEEAVLSFNEAMKSCYSQLGTSFEKFPRGCCRDIAGLLAAYLKDDGFGVFEYVSGWSRERNSSYAWLERDGMIIDASADQYLGESNPAMVTRDRSFHSQFIDYAERRSDGDFHLVGDAYHLPSAYSCMKQFIG